MQFIINLTWPVLGLIWFPSLGSRSLQTQDTFHVSLQLSSLDSPGICRLSLVSCADWHCFAHFCATTARSSFQYCSKIRHALKAANRNHQGVAFNCWDYSWLMVNNIEPHPYLDGRPNTSFQRHVDTGLQPTKSVVDNYKGGLISLSPN